MEHFLRIWSIHPRFLDRQGLLAVWREGLLAQAVLRGRTRGYTRHPQLARFRARPAPLTAINAYLWHIRVEASVRGYDFDPRKVRRPRTGDRIPLRRGQLEYEWRRLLAKLRRRDLSRFRLLRDAPPRPHPIFRVIPGGIEPWERVESKPIRR